MISYNTTFMMTPQLEEEFLSFVRQVYIPGILSQGVLRNAQLKRIHQHDNDVDALSLALSFEANSHAELLDYLQSEGNVYPEQMLAKFGERVVGFTTMMEHIEL